MQANGKSQGGGDVDKAKHRGRAYQCLRCFHQQGVSVIDVKQRIEEHIMKIHLSLDQVPFYCSLCLFRCRDRATLDDHVKNFSRHKQMVADRKCNNSSGFLKENPTPYKFGQEDYYVYSQEESVNIYVQKSQTKKGPQETHHDLVEQAVSDVFTATGEPLNNTDVNAAMTTDSSMGDPKTMQQLSSFLAKNLQDTLLQSILTLNPSMNFFQNVPTPAATTTSVSVDTNRQTPCQDETDSVSHALPPSQTPEVVPLSFPTTPLCLSLSSMEPQKSIPSTPKQSSSALSTPTPAVLTPEPPVSLPAPDQITSKATLSTPAPQPSLPVLNSTTLSSRQRSPTHSLEMESTEQVLDLSIKSSTRGNQLTDSQPLADRGPALAIPSLAPTVRHQSVEEVDTVLDLSIHHSPPDDVKEASGQKEDILDQLLGNGEDHGLEEDVRLVRATSTPPHISSPAIPEHIKPTRSKEQSIETPGTLLRSMENLNKKLIEEVERNSRSIRCLKKVVEDRAQDISAIKNLLENFVSYFRTNAREERRRQEKRDEERKNEREEYRRWESEKRKEEDRKRRIEEESQNNKRVKTMSNKENTGSPRIKSVLGKFTSENKKHK